MTRVTLPTYRKPTWRTGLIKRIRHIPPQNWRDLSFVVFLFLFQASLMVIGLIYAS
jgi:hypothetical protein